MKKIITAFVFLTLITPSMLFSQTSIRVEIDNYPDELKKELEAVGFSPSIESILWESIDGSQRMSAEVRIVFSRTITQPERSIVDGVIAAHIGPRKNKPLRKQRIKNLLSTADDEASTPFEVAVVQLLRIILKSLFSL